MAFLYLSFMLNPKEFYIRQLKFLNAKQQKLNKQLGFISLLRLILFIGLLLSLYSWHKTNEILIILILWLPLFLSLVSKSTDLKSKIAKNLQLIKINEVEMAMLHHEIVNLPDGSEFINPQHEYSFDIDLFGPGSFFKYINRSTQKNARRVLAQLLTANDPCNVIDKQKAVKDLSEKPRWRQNFLAEAQMNNLAISPQEIDDRLKNYQYFSSSFLNIFLPVYASISFLIIAGVLSEVFSYKILILWILTGLGLVSLRAKKIARLNRLFDELVPGLQAYHKLMTLIIAEPFTSKLLNDEKKQFQANSIKHLPLTKLIKLYNQKEMTHNIVVKFIGNALFLSDLYFAYRLESWMKINRKDLSKSLEAVHNFEAYVSLGNFAFNHPSFNFPTILTGSSVIKAQALGHPLIHPDKRIYNDFNIHLHNFFIITGANMAGKSTFLRTVALSLIMANAGLPVCASAYQYKPIKLITSMRTSDSLQAETSYFFSELQRLKYIVEKVKVTEHFVVLDEILKGTNSKDKAIGSQKFLEGLIKTYATGIIATHDLSLCQLADYHTGVKNYFFDAVIQDDQLYFDYKLKSGICQNMNASFLLKKMGIID